MEQLYAERLSLGIVSTLIKREEAIQIIGRGSWKVRCFNIFFLKSHVFIFCRPFSCRQSERSKKVDKTSLSVCVMSLRSCDNIV